MLFGLAEPATVVVISGFAQENWSASFARSTPCWAHTSAARRAAEVCAQHGVDLAKLALQFSCANPDITTTVAGSANPNNIRKWAEWIAEPIDQKLLAEVQAIFAPVKNIGHTEGLPENN